LSVALTLEDIARLARNRLNNPAYDIFVAFLNELSGGAGVWGKLSAAAMAKAHVEIVCSLKDDDNSGFVIDAGAEAALGGGGGYGFYAGFKFKKPKRFYLYASERITREIVSEAKKILPSDLIHTAEFLEFLLPVSLNAAYELGQRASNSFDDPEIYVKIFSECFTAQAQRYTLDKLTDYGLRVVSRVIRDSFVHIANKRISRAEKQRLIVILNKLIDFFQTEELHSVNINNVINSLTDVLEVILPDEKSKWQTAISVTWFSLASVEAIRYGFVTASASGSASFAGLKTPPASNQILTLSDPPAIVAAEFRREVKRLPSRFTFGDAVEYLIEYSGALDELVKVIPETGNIINIISDNTGIQTADVLNFFLDASFGKDLSTNQLYQKLRDFAKEGIEDYVFKTLLPALKKGAAGNEDYILYIDKVVKPAFLLTKNFLFSRLDRIVSGNSPDDPLLYSKTFSTALSTLLFKIFKENIIVLFEITFNHVLDNLHTGFKILADSFKNNTNNHIVSDIMQNLIRPILPPFIILAEAEKPARKLAYNLFNAMAVSFGPAIISHKKRSDLFTALSKVIYSIDSTDAILKSPDAIEDTFKEICECAFIPDEDGLTDLFNINVDILSMYMETVAPLVADALAIFMIEITQKPVEKLEEAAKDFVISLLEIARDLWEEYQRLLEEFETAVEDLQQAALNAADALQTAAQKLKSKSIRDLILDDIKAEGK
ncbi:MAG: hypothetical protein M3P82_06800, partial [Bacteroidota bacterium]|nr:hypothetical protein [Bacteroidota bacterium]